jgi:hypothetical protein
MARTRNVAILAATCQLPTPTRSGSRAGFRPASSWQHEGGTRRFPVETLHVQTLPSMIPATAKRLHPPAGGPARNVSRVFDRSIFRNVFRGHACHGVSL